MNLRCLFGSHRYGQWKWSKRKALTQHRVCFDCGKRQTCGDSNERSMHESRRDR